MPTVAVWNHKGGSGKTTLAVHLAYAAERAGLTTLLIDTDRQGNALQWLVGDDAQTLQPGNLQEHSSKLSVLYAPDGPATNLPAFDVVIVDCPPALEVAASLTPDLWIVPIDSAFALRGAANVHADVSATGIPLLFVLNRADAGGLRIQKGLMDELLANGLDVWPEAIPDNATLYRAAAHRVPVWDAPFGSKNINGIIGRFTEGVFRKLGIRHASARKRGAS
jgi:chromosome partitioning protein